VNEIKTDQAPEAVGAYSQGIIQGDTIYTSGQIGLDPDSGQMVDDSFEDEANQTLKNLIAVVRAGGGTAQSVLKTTVYLNDLSHYASLNEIYQSYFSEPLPARSAIEVATLPRNVRVEIEAVASRV